MDFDKLAEILLAIAADEEDKEVTIDIYDDFFIIEAQRTRSEHVFARARAVDC